MFVIVAVVVAASGKLGRVEIVTLTVGARAKEGKGEGGGELEFLFSLPAPSPLPLIRPISNMALSRANCAPKEKACTAG